MFKKAIALLFMIALVGCATAPAGPKLTNVNQTVIGGKSIYMGQTKAAVEAALGAPDKVDVFDPATNTVAVLMMDEMKKRGDWHQVITWEYRRDGKTYRISFDEGVDSVKAIRESI